MMMKGLSMNTVKANKHGAGVEAKTHSVITLDILIWRMTVSRRYGRRIV
jgi:hypothetical protein